MSKPTEQQFTTPDVTEIEAELSRMSEPQGSGSSVDRLLERHRDRLMGIEGVVMVGEGADELGRPAIVVGVKERHQLKAVPRVLEGMPVVVWVIGEVDALGRGGSRPRGE